MTPEVAEAAKVIENTQRDVNIAMMNEFALIFHRLDIDTQDVLAAAGTKSYFLPFKPGLVGPGKPAVINAPKAHTILLEETLACETYASCV
jgi:UDP-N-acetyl-D-mannosaminuronate dehydrogenase